MNSYVLDVTGVKREITPVNGKDFQLDELQSIVGGYIQIIELDDDFIMVMNEEGKILGLKFNCFATSLACMFNAIRPGDYIVGNVLICKTRMVK